MASGDAKKLHAAVYQYLVRCGLNTTANALLEELHAVSAVRGRKLNLPSLP